jgi:putative sterol carrier protein
MSATPQEWKKILRKENKFLTDFMLGKIKLERGSKVTVLGLAPHAPTLVEALSEIELQFPDEMSPD